jgi:holliday junction DNA helicase RuvA
MIASLAGVIEQIEPDAAVINVGGVGYLVFCSTRTIGRLPPPGSPARLLIETHVREDHIHLYGFIDTAEREWFGLLTTVQGVGARLALSVLSAVAPERLGLVIFSQDKAALTQAEGVGSRLAARVINELRDKIGNTSTPGSPTPGSPATVALPDNPARGGGATADAVSALENLGVGRTEALGAIATAAQRLGGEARADVLIKAGLEELAR